MEIFDFDDYRKFTNSYIQQMPKQGFGELKKISEFLNVSSTFVSQVFQGNKSLNLEQGILLCEYLKLNEIQTEYYLNLILIERAGTDKLKKYYQKESLKIIKKSQQISTRLKNTSLISDQAKLTFYSDWSYIAVRLLTSIPGFQDIDSISDYLGLSHERVSEIITFLKETELIKNENNRISMGPARTHLNADDPLVNFHHLNWRHKAIENLNYKYEAKLHYSAPTVLGYEDSLLVRKHLLKLIESLGKVVDASPNEELMCLNIDWFKVKN